MNQHFTNLLAKRDTIPTAEQVARSQAFKLTKYAAGQVIPAAVDLCDAHDEAVRAYADATEFIHARTTEEERQDPAWQRYVGADVAAVLEARWKWFDNGVQLGVNFASGRRAVESYPLSRWADRARKFRRAARELRKVLDAQKAVAAA